MPDTYIIWKSRKGRNYMAVFHKNIGYTLSNMTKKEKKKKVVLRQRYSQIQSIFCGQPSFVLRKSGFPATCKASSKKGHFPPKSIPLWPTSASTSEEAKADWTIWKPKDSSRDMFCWGEKGDVREGAISLKLDPETPWTFWALWTLCWCLLR